MSPSTPQFSSPALQAAFEASRHHLEGVDENRNRVSDDIKALEAYLKGLGLKEAFRFLLPIAVFNGYGELIPEHDHNATAILLAANEGAVTVCQEALVFSPGAQAGRLIYEYASWTKSGELDRPPIFEDRESPEIDTRPLIETKWEIRHRLYSHLPAFLIAFGESLAILPLDLSVEHDQSY